MRVSLAIAITVVASAAPLVIACTPLETTWRSPEAFKKYHYTAVSLVELIANPAKYNGWRVEVTGYLDCQFEGDKLFLTQQDQYYYTTANSIHVGCFHNQIGFGEAERRRWHGERVTVFGSFTGFSREREEEEASSFVVYMGPNNTGSIDPIDAIWIDE